MPMVTAYSAVSSGQDSFKSESFSQDDEPSFHWQHICQPMVFRLWYVRPSCQTAVWSESRSAVSRRWWSVNESRRTYWFPSGSHWAYIDSAIKFAVRSVTSPSSKVTVYSRFPRMGLGLARPVGLPSASLFHAVTRPLVMVPPLGNRWSTPI